MSGPPNQHHHKPCRRCKRTMVAQGAYDKTPGSWKVLGYVRANAHGWCNGCYAWARRNGALPPSIAREAHYYRRLERAS